MKCFLDPLLQRRLFVVTKYVVHTYNHNTIPSKPDSLLWSGSNLCSAHFYN
ncbi:hypothetical protein RSAG8_05841, partial [Rhizoctonia solani AG-8 WAC10335]